MPTSKWKEGEKGQGTREGRERGGEGREGERPDRQILRPRTGADTERCSRLDHVAEIGRHGVDCDGDELST